MLAVHICLSFTVGSSVIEQRILSAISALTVRNHNDSHSSFYYLSLVISETYLELWGNVSSISYVDNVFCMSISLGEKSYLLKNLMVTYATGLKLKHTFFFLMFMKNSCLTFIAHAHVLSWLGEKW